MAKKNRPAHGGFAFHKCGDDYLFEMFDSNGQPFAHFATNQAGAAGLAGAILDQVIADAKAAGIPVTAATGGELKH